MKSPTTFLVFKIYMLQILYIQFLSLLLGIILVYVSLNYHIEEEEQTEESGILNPDGKKSHSQESRRRSRELPQYFLACKKLVTSGAKL